MSAWVFALGYGAVLALALGMRTHRRRLTGAEGWTRGMQLCRSGGYVMLAGALGVAVGQAGWAAGLVAWFGSVAVGGFVLTVLLALAPRWIAAPLGLALVLSTLPAVV